MKNMIATLRRARGGGAARSCPARRPPANKEEAKRRLEEAKRRLDEGMSRAKAEFDARMMVIAGQALSLSNAGQVPKTDGQSVGQAPVAAKAPKQQLPVVATSNEQTKRKREADPIGDERQVKRQRLGAVADPLSTMNACTYRNLANPCIISAELQRTREAEARRRQREASACAANMDYSRGCHHDRFVRWVRDASDTRPHFVDLQNWPFTLDEYFGRAPYSTCAK